MFNRRMELLRIFGFSIKVDLSWLLIFLLITWSLATGFFPLQFGGLPAWQYWVLGAAGAMALFFSVALHELSHSLVARAFGLEIRGITLFFFGGVSEMEDEPADTKTELLVGLAGPASSLVLGIFFLAVTWGVRATGWTNPIVGLLGYIALMNLLLAAFNMLPGFPLDGGRVLRAVLWWWRKDRRWATRVATQAGRAMGMALIILGGVSAVFGNVVGGVWLVLIGLFLRFIAGSAYRDTLVRDALRGEKVSRFTRTEPAVVPASITVEQLVEDYVYKYHHKLYPVIDGETLLGCVRIERVSGLSRGERPVRLVSDLIEPCSEANTVHPDDDAAKALALIDRERSGRVMVVNGERHLLGVVTMENLLAFVALKMELGDV